MLPSKKSQVWLPNIFNDFFGNEWLEQANVSIPAVNIIEKENEFLVELATPGLTKDDFSIKIEDDNTLLISVEKENKSEDKDKGGRYLRREFSYSKFQKKMLLPDNVNKDKIEAAVNNGVLSIHIPKIKEEEQPKTTKTIEIK